MYEEMLKRKPLKGFGTFFAIILLVYGILALMLLVGVMQEQTGIRWLQYILLIGVFVLLLFLLLRQLTKYVYTVGSGRLEVFRQTGGRRRLLFACPVSDIIKMGKKEEVPAMAGKRRIYLFYPGENSFFIVLKNGIIVIAPTERFVLNLREAYEKTHC